jgi:Kef-type K+ transport system membrane component KefB
MTGGVGDLFTGLAIVLGLTSVLGYLFKILKQPPILAYISAGILANSSMLGIIKTGTDLEIFSKFGVTLLLFSVGLNLSTNDMKKELQKGGSVAVIQVIIISLVGALVSQELFNISKLGGLMVGLCLAFSSTIVSLKQLSDENNLVKLFGRLSTSILLVQDLLATFAFLIFNNFKDGTFLGWGNLVSTLPKAMLFLLFVFLVTKFFIKPFEVKIGKNKESFFIASLAWAFGISALASNIGLSFEIGAIVAGISLANSNLSFEVNSRIKPLKDFFLALFFIAMGLQIGSSLESVNLSAVIFLTIVVCFIKPIVVILLLRDNNFSNKTSYRTGFSLAHISEFSIVLILLGSNNNLISHDVVSVILVTFAASILISSYINHYFDLLSQKLNLNFNKLDNLDIKKHYDIALFGYAKAGLELLNSFKKISTKILVVDYDPTIAIGLERDPRIDFVLGDLTQFTTLEEIDLEKIKMLAICINDASLNANIIKNISKLNPKCIIIAYAEDKAEATMLYDNGADYVVIPHMVGTEKLSSFIAKNKFNKTDYKSHKLVDSKKIANSPN